MMHHIYLLAQGGRLHIAPLSEPQRVLDLGTGTGIWALDFADQYPEAEILGVDISPIQPSWVAPNCRFVIDDIEESWDYPPSQRFDYIHARSMAGSIADWRALFRQALVHLKPGGWFEIQEFDGWFHSQNVGGLPPDSAILQWQGLLNQASTQVGKKLNCSSELGGYLEEVGFKNIQTQVIKLPIGTWPANSKLRTTGRFLQVQFLDAIDAMTLGFFSRVLNWSDKEIQVITARVRTEFGDNSKHLFMYCRFHAGRAPTQGKEE